jgi:hypothetical protein
MIKFPVQIQLMNGKQVELTESEFDEFISDVMVPNPQWQHSGLLDKDQVTRYLNHNATVEDLRKVIRYILVYQENLSLTAYLFAKSENQNNANESKGYNLATLVKVRALHGLATTDSVTLLNKIAGKMTNLCMEVGADPL